MKIDIFSLVIIFERLPDMRLSVNGLYKLSHWGSRSRIVAPAKEEAFYLAKEALSKCDYWKVPEMARIHYEFYSRTRSVKDIEGGLIPACKPWVDGLVRAGALKSDSGWHLWIGRGELRSADHNQTRLIIEAME